MKKSFFSKQHKRLITDPMGGQNPITIQVLGICSALAITTQLENALVMTLAVVFVMISASTLISLMRNIIPNRITKKAIKKINNNEYILASSKGSLKIYTNIGSIIIDPPEPNKPKNNPAKTNKI